jgi:hypothetical protein
MSIRSLQVTGSGISLIKIPLGLDAAMQPYMPEVRRLYWLHRPLLDPQDPEDARPAVVVALPPDETGLIKVVQRSSTERNGQFHARQPEFKLSKDGWFSRLRPIQAVLWTPSTAESIDLLVDEETFSYILKDFGLVKDYGS